MSAMVMNFINAILASPLYTSIAAGLGVGGFLFVVRPSYLYDGNLEAKNMWLSEIPIGLLVFLGVMTYFFVTGKLSLPYFGKMGGSSYSAPIESYASAEPTMMSMTSSPNDLLSPDQFHM